MLFQHILNICGILEKRSANAEKIKNYLLDIENADIKTTTLGAEIFTEVIQIFIPAKNPQAKTVAVLGRLGGVGARDRHLGLVSDADGAVAALAVAAEILEMRKDKDFLDVNVYISTHICPNAPVIKHEPVDFMGSPVSIKELNDIEIKTVHPQPNLIFSVDTTKGNQILNHRGIAITPTVLNGYILKVDEDLLRILQDTTGEEAYVLPITTQDITPYDNGIYHINSIMQPATAADVPVIGVAITAKTSVAGCTTGASHVTDIELTARFIVEACKHYAHDKREFIDFEEYKKLTALYGSLEHLKQ